MGRKLPISDTTRYANLLTQLALIRSKEEEYYIRAKGTDDIIEKEKYMGMAMTLGNQWIQLSAKTNDFLIFSFVRKLTQ